VTGSGRSAEHLLAVTGRRVAAVQSGDLEAVMASLVDDPVFDFYPLGLRLAGPKPVRRYYERFLADVIPHSSGSLLATFVGENEVAFEFHSVVTLPGGEPEAFRLLAVQPVVGDRVAGERLFASERYFRLIVGEELWTALVAVPEEGA
jgi:hypothetical protein